MTLLKSYCLNRYQQTEQQFLHFVKANGGFEDIFLNSVTFILRHLLIPFLMLLIYLFISGTQFMVKFTSYSIEYILDSIKNNNFNAQDLIAKFSRNDLNKVYSKLELNTKQQVAQRIVDKVNNHAIPCLEVNNVVDEFTSLDYFKLKLTVEEYFEQHSHDDDLELPSFVLYQSDVSNREKYSPLSLMNLPEPFSYSDLKLAYKAACKKYHPDLGGDTLLFTQLNTCYRLLIVDFFSSLFDYMTDEQQDVYHQMAEEFIKPKLSF